MKLFVVLSAVLAIGYSAPNDITSGSSPDPIGLPDIFNLDALPDNYSNSTHEVQVINGSRIEVNQTVSKNSDDVSFFAKILLTVTSSKNDQVDNHLQNDDAELPLFGAHKLAPSDILNQNNLGLLEWLQQSFSRINGNANGQLDLSGSPSSIVKGSPGIPTDTSVKAEDPSAFLPSPAVERNVISYDGDTNVNYIGVQPRDTNPDAEIFDVDLVREDANRFFESRPQPMRSQPMRSQPMRSQPMRSQPMRSQPIRSQSMRSQPIRSQPMRSQSIRSQPMRSQPMRSQPMRSQPIRSQPMRSQPMRSQPIRSQSMRSQPIRSQPIRAYV